MMDAKELEALRAEIERLRRLCGEVYQAAGIYGLPERFMDALGDAAAGNYTRWKGESLLPCDVPANEGE